MVNKSKAAGSFIGGILGNPAIVLGGIAIAAILIFREPFLKALTGIQEGLVNIKLPEIKLPELPKFELPDINIFNTSGQSELAGQTVDLQGRDVIIPPDTTVNPDGTVSSSTPPIVVNGGATFQENLFAETRAGVFDTLFEAGFDTNIITRLLNEATNLSDLSAILFRANQGLFTENVDIINQPINQGTGLTPQEEAGLFQGQSVILGSDRPANTPIPVGLPEGFDFFLANPDRPALFGGTGFVGGSINPVPIANLSLSQIIDMFNVTASQAANIQGIAQDNFGSFDFGTNTGGGIGSIIPTISSLIGGSDVNVSSSQFEGLSASQIANILTGGNIQNF